MPSPLEPRRHVRVMYVGLALIVGSYVYLEGLFNHTLMIELGVLGSDLRAASYQRLSEIGRQLTATAVTLVLFVWLVKRWWFRLPAPAPRAIAVDGRWTVPIVAGWACILVVTWFGVYFGEKQWVDRSTEHLVSPRSRMQAHHGIVATASFAAYLTAKGTDGTARATVLPALQIWPKDPCLASADEHALPVTAGMFADSGMLTLKASLPWIVTDRAAQSPDGTRCQVQQSLVRLVQQHHSAESTYRQLYVPALDAVALSYDATLSVGEEGRRLAAELLPRGSDLVRNFVAALSPQHQHKAQSCLTRRGKLPLAEAPMDYLAVKCLYQVVQADVRLRADEGSKQLAAEFENGHTTVLQEVRKRSDVERQRVATYVDGWSAAPLQEKRALQLAMATQAARDPRIVAFVEESGYTSLPEQLSEAIVRMDFSQVTDCSVLVPKIREVVTRAAHMYIGSQPSGIGHRLDMVDRHLSEGGDGVAECRSQLAQGLADQALQAANSVQSLFATPPAFGGSFEWIAALSAIVKAQSEPACANVLSEPFVAAWQTSIDQRLRANGVLRDEPFAFTSAFLEQSSCKDAPRAIDDWLSARTRSGDNTVSAWRDLDPMMLLMQLVMSPGGRQQAALDRSSELEGVRLNLRAAIVKEVLGDGTMVSAETAQAVADEAVPAGWRPTQRAAFAESLRHAIDVHVVRPRIGAEIRRAYGVADDAAALAFLAADIPSADRYIARPEVQGLLQRVGESSARGALRILGFGQPTVDAVAMPQPLSRSFSARWRDEVYAPVLAAANGSEWKRRISDDPVDYAGGGRCEQAGRSAHVLAQLPLLAMTLSMLGMLYHGSKFVVLVACAIAPSLEATRLGPLKATTCAMTALAALAVALPLLSPPKAMQQDLTGRLIDNVASTPLRLMVSGTMTWQGWYEPLFSAQHDAVCRPSADAAARCDNIFDLSMREHAAQAQGETSKRDAEFNAALDRDPDVASLRRWKPGLEDEASVVRARQALTYGLFCELPGGWSGR